jgi:hypothetical protein
MTKGERWYKSKHHLKNKMDKMPKEEIIIEEGARQIKGIRWYNHPSKLSISN